VRSFKSLSDRIFLAIFTGIPIKNPSRLFKSSVNEFHLASKTDYYKGDFLLKEAE